MWGHGHRTKAVHGVRVLLVALAKPKPWASTPNHLREAAKGQLPTAQPRCPPVFSRDPLERVGGVCRSFPLGVTASTPAGFLYPLERALHMCPSAPRHRAGLMGIGTVVHEREWGEGMQPREEGGEEKDAGM